MNNFETESARKMRSFFILLAIVSLACAQQVHDLEFNSNHLFCPARNCYLTSEQAGVTNVCTQDWDCIYNLAVLNECGFPQGRPAYYIGTGYKCLDLDNDGVSHCALSCFAQPSTPCVHNQDIDTDAILGGDYTMQINCSFMRNGTEVYADCPCHRGPECNSLPVCSV